MPITLSDLEKVNKEYNQYEYESEVGDDWTPIDLTVDQADDCDSYATAKAEKLIRLGCPKSSMRIAVCVVTERGKVLGGHLVLLVNLDGQTYCLDNRFTFPIRVQDLTGYAWVSFWHLDTGKWYLPLGLEIALEKE